MAGIDHIQIMVHFLFGEFALFRFDSCPFKGEAVSIESCLMHQTDIIPVGMIMIRCVSGGFFVSSGFHVFLCPCVTVDVIAFDLAARRCGADQKCFIHECVLSFVCNGVSYTAAQYDP